MNPLFAAAGELQAFCRSHGWRFCFIGGLANLRWGEPRLTLDVDLTLLTGFGGEAEFVDELLGAFRPRIPDGREFALAHRVLLLWSSAEIALDVALGAMPFEVAAVARASDFAIGESRSLLTCSAEDLVVFKAFAGRDRDWADIEGIVARQARRLDRELVWRELLPLLELKEDSSSAGRLRALFAGVV